MATELRFITLKRDSDSETLIAVDRIDCVSTLWVNDNGAESPEWKPDHERSAIRLRGWDTDIIVCHPVAEIEAMLRAGSEVN